MTTYNTGNPIGSVSVKDLYDNAENLDAAVNTEADRWTDRLGKDRLSLAGMARLSDASTAIAAAERAEDARDDAIDAASNAALYGGAVRYESYAEMQADTSKPEGTKGEVWGDANASLRGFYNWTGVSWEWADPQPASAVILSSEIEERTSLIRKNDALVSPPFDQDVASVEVDTDGRVVMIRLKAGAMYREAPVGLVRLLDSTDMMISTVSQAVVPEAMGAVSDVATDSVGRVQQVTTSRGVQAATDSGLEFSGRSADPNEFDVVIYGATLSGLCAAIAASREGRRAVLLEPTDFLGGAIVAGLAFQDFSSPTAFNNVLLRGIAREFFAMLAPYNLNRALASGVTDQGVLNSYRGGPQNRTHPADCRAVFGQLVERYGIQVRTGVRIDAARHVWKRGKRITGVVTPAGVVKGRYFIDASYEGDLIKHSGAGYRYGRESEEEYGETGAGFRRANARSITGYTSNTFYPVAADPGTAHGGADDGCMGFCFRGVMTQEAERLAWPMPDGYDRAMFAPLAEQIAAYSETAFVTNVPNYDSGVGGRLHAYDLRNNQRVNWNSNPWLGHDLIGKSKKYRDGNWASRDAFVSELELWNKGIFYFLANDSAVPQVIRDKANLWGLPVDEFQDSPLGAGWPHWPYIRAGIRLRGAETLTGVHQLAQQTWATRVISWVYQQDSKACTAWAHPTDPTTVLEEGYISAPDLTAPYEIPAEVMFEGAGGLENLIVSNLISCTNVAWTAYRLEPALGMMGHAAGLLAAQCMDRADAAVQNYEYNDLRLRLNAGGFNW